jgi:hypothetical protein
MSNGSSIFEVALFEIVKEITEINHHISIKSLTSIQDIKKRFLALRTKIEQMVPVSITMVVNGKEINCHKELKSEIEKAYSVAVQFYKSLFWGEFGKLNPKTFPELYEMMVDQNGDLHRSYDSFNGTLATMDFHGYTQFSKDIKYNKTPLFEFGDILPSKISQICKICKTIVYEMEGDTLILIGPENPIYIFDAILSIIELCRQKLFNPNSDPKKFHGIDLKNPMIKPFELNAAVTTGGSTFINQNGHIIGSMISETSRMLKTINTKKPNKSGIILSDKVFRKIEKYQETQTTSHVSIQGFKISDPVIVDVKGTRLNFREVYLEEKKYIDDTTEFSKKLSEEIKKKNPSKWHNILSYFLNLMLASMNDIKCTVQIGNETLSHEEVKKILEVKFYEWVSNPSPAIIYDILKMSNLLYNSSEEIRDVTAIYYEFIQENYSFIAKRLEEFYQLSLKKESQATPGIKRNIENYEAELEKLKKRFPTKRMLETLLMNEQVKSQMLDVPYLGKK